MQMIEPMTRPVVDLETPWLVLQGSSQHVLCQDKEPNDYGNTKGWIEVARLSIEQGTGTMRTSRVQVLGAST